MVNLILHYYPDAEDLQRIILIGHSMGGAVITHIAANNLLPRPPLGIVVLDIVEGTALENLSHMKRYLETRPTSFRTLDEAVDWAVTSKLILNRESADISVPYLFQYDEAQSKYGWITDFAASEPFWRQWFKGLSGKFLSSTTCKLLVLANTERLDKELMIGQMQGKFQLQLINDAGHAVAEDTPKALAKVTLAFWHRFSQPLIISRRPQ